jgi:hypothetical protein
MTLRSGEIIDGPPALETGFARAAEDCDAAWLIGFGLAAETDDEAAGDVTGFDATGFGVSLLVSIGSFILLFENMVASRSCCQKLAVSGHD